MTSPWQWDQLDQRDERQATSGQRQPPYGPPSVPPDRMSHPWQQSAGMAGLPPLDPPTRPPSRARLPVPPEPPAPPRLPAPIPPIDRARIARLDRRALAVVLVCVALLLLGAAAPFLWANYFAATTAQTPANPPQVNAPAPTLPPTLPPTTVPTTPPAPTQIPTPVPTRVPPVAPTPTPPPPRPTATPRPAPIATPPPPVPVIQSGPLSAPARLTLVCSAPASLPFQNSGDTLLSWSVTIPQGVLVNGWSSGVHGTIAPRGRLVLAITERPGTYAGSAQLVLTAPGARLAVALAQASC